jgi:ankyrin repeat protein
VFDDAKISELLLRYGAVTTVNPRSGQTALHEASGQADSACLTLLLAHGADPLERDNQGETALCNAARIASEENVRRLLEAHEKVQAAEVDSVPRLPNMFAEDDELDPYPEAVAEKIAFELSQDPNESEVQREAAWRCTVLIARYQLAAINPAVAIGEAETLLMYHVNHGPAQDVRAWLPKVRNVNFTDHNVGWSLLVSAIDRRSLEIVDLLLGAGADPNWFGHPRWTDTPLDYAIREGQHEIAAHLRHCGGRAGRRK